ncbi:hypothetical protein C3B44_03300 [Corynebacterium yudongzhengii]|uniref:SURF1-like protein n=1 Tax=Corynebacterium yudongzhengii TaxID=2080740 RepID=A0A2U1T7E9_9CORY|nr:hypothetical protein C3B44_03300 [Corynebacterium yudongzhengii]PWC01930.1 SURF1 family protein [Corynebacterium yudongzhengii]
MWRRFLTPGWLFLTLFVVIFSYFSFTFFAPWQLGKDEQIVERNEQIEAAYEADPVPVEQILDGEGFSDGDQWTRVILNGRFLPEDEVLLRLRSIETLPAYHSLTPFQLDSGPIILVNRGYEPAGEANAVPEIADPPAGEVSTIGMVQLAEPPSDRAALQDQGYQQVYTINPEQIGELTGHELVDGYVQLSEGEPGVLNAIPVPKLDRGTHLSYGLQWLAFGVLAPAGLVYFVISELRERRRVREEDAEMAAADDRLAGDEDEEDLSQHPDARVVHRSRDVRDRYGDAKPDFYAKFAKRQRERQ